MGSASGGQTGTVEKRHLFPYPRCSERVEVLLEGEKLIVGQKDLGTPLISGNALASLRILD